LRVGLFGNADIAVDGILANPIENRVEENRLIDRADDVKSVDTKVTGSVP
jgi:hypothetical protein